MLTEKQIDVIWALSYAGLTVAGAAKNMKITEDTVRRKIKEIQAETGLNPRDFWDLTDLIEMVKKEEDTEC